MFLLPPSPGEGDLERISRRPTKWWSLESDGWTFLPENEPWDSEQRECVSRATGLHQLSPSEWANGEPDRWWKELAREYTKTGSFHLALTKVAPRSE